MDYMEDLRFCKACGKSISEGEFCMPKDYREISCRKLYWETIRQDDNFHLEGLRIGEPNMTFVGKV